MVHRSDDAISISILQITDIVVKHFCPPQMSRFVRQQESVHLKSAKSEHFKQGRLQVRILSEIDKAGQEFDIEQSQGLPHCDSAAIWRAKFEGEESLQNL